jgi:nitrite reductase/ring-hydroxylating ferredoxin subunit
MRDRHSTRGETGPSDPARPAFQAVGETREISEGLVVPFYVQARKRRISVARVAERLYAFDDLCTCGPTPCPLSGGLLTGTTLMCQCHGSSFDIVTGAIVEGSASQPLEVYATQEADGTVLIRL